MSFVKIAESRAVKKIVALLRAEAKRRKAISMKGKWHSALPSDEFASIVLDDVAEHIEQGAWRDVELPKPPKRKKKRRG
jgi:hypothetical protein